MNSTKVVLRLPSGAKPCQSIKSGRRPGSRPNSPARTRPTTGEPPPCANVCADVRADHTASWPAGSGRAAVAGQSMLPFWERPSTALARPTTAESSAATPRSRPATALVQPMHAEVILLRPIHHPEHPHWSSPPRSARASSRATTPRVATPRGSMHHTLSPRSATTRASSPRHQAFSTQTSQPAPGVADSMVAAADVGPQWSNWRLRKPPVRRPHTPPPPAALSWTPAELARSLTSLGDEFAPLAQAMLAGEHRCIRRWSRRQCTTHTSHAAPVARMHATFKVRRAPCLCLNGCRGMSAL